MGVQGLDPASPVSWDQAHAPRSPVPQWAECFNKPHLPGAPHSLDPSCLNEFFLWPLNSWLVSGLSLLHWLRLLSFLKNILFIFKRLYWICYSIIIFMFFYFCPQVMCNLSSPTWGLTHNPCIGSCSHWTTREASDFCLLLLISSGPTSTPISGFFALHFFFLFYNPLATIFFLTLLDANVDILLIRWWVSTLESHGFKWRRMRKTVPAIWTARPTCYGLYLKVSIHTFWQEY